MKKILLILLVSLFLVGCGDVLGGDDPSKENTGDDNTVIDFEIEASYMPKSITGYSSNSRAISNIATVDWKSFGIVPQIGNNYNSWVENTVLPQVKELSTQKSDMEKIESDLYDLKWESFDDNNQLQEIFMTSTNFGAWTYIVHTSEGEIRQLLFRRENNAKHLLALFYRKNVDDMNDIVEIIETPNKLITKCVRTYDISEPSQFFLNFASITDLQGPLEETTGVLLSKENSGEITLDSLFQESDILTDLYPASPAVFDNDRLLIEENALTGYSDHPDKDEVLDLVFEGINNKNVAEVVIDNTSLESTLGFSEYKSTISTFISWSELDNSNSQSNPETTGEWGSLNSITYTFRNFDSIKNQALYSIQSYIDGTNSMDDLVGNSDYIKEVYLADYFRFQTNDDFTKWRFTNENSDEIRQLLYLKDESATPAVEYYYALFYRQDIHDMNDLVIIKTIEDKITYGASMKVYNISSTPTYYDTFFIQDLETELGSGISISDTNDDSFSYFNKDGLQNENTTTEITEYPSLSEVKSFANSIPYLDDLDNISINIDDLSGGLELSSSF